MLAAGASHSGVNRKGGSSLGLQEVSHDQAAIVIGDDHLLVVEATTKLLEPEFEIVGIVGDGRSPLEKAPELKPDIVILDLGMPLLNGIDAGRELKKALAESKIIVLTPCGIGHQPTC